VRLILTATLALTLTALVGCGKTEDTPSAPPGATEAAPEAAPAAEVEGLAVAAQTLTFEVQRDADQRPLVVSTKVQIPSGWAPPEGSLDGVSGVSFSSDADNPLAQSRVTVSSTCHGRCGPEHFETNIREVAAQQTRFAGEGARVLIDEELRPGVWGFAIESGPEGAKVHSVGVSHWAGPAWPSIIFCSAHLQRDHRDAWRQLYDACAAAEVTITDPLLSGEVLDREREQLARCPEATTLTYRADPEREGEPSELGEVVDVYAHAPRPGYVNLFFANFEMTTTNLREAPLEGDQRVLRVSLEHRSEGEVLSGRYPTSYDGDHRVGLGIHTEGGRTLGWSAHSTEGAVEIIARTHDRICGRVDIKGGNRGDLSGEFSVDLDFGRAR